MTMYLGDFAAGATVHFKWNTFSTTGASITRATDGVIKIYKDGSSTERSSASGVTDTEDFDSRTGVHLCSIDLSDNTDAGFYAAAHEYSVYITAATIDGQVVNAVLAHFSIQNRYYPTALDAAGVRSAVGLASANLDTQLTTIDDFLDTEVAAIKTQTDKLTFTLSGQVDANIQSVNDTAVTGDGSTSTPWGP